MKSTLFLPVPGFDGQLPSLSVEVIRHTDPATYQEFQNQLSAMSAAAASGPSSAPGPSKADIVKVI